MLIFLELVLCLQEKKNFTYLINYKKKNYHVLMTNEIYFWFYLWSIGTEIIKFNPICIIIYLFVLYKFFDDKIKIEEE